ncbi:MAG TPA: ABC transporter permease [Eubacterium sp.]|nr:ABC transporter permease [Eubacterium sp.]
MEENVDFTVLLNAMPGAISQGLIWGIMAIGVFLTYKVLDVADLTVDGSMCTGAAVCAMMLMNGYNIWVAMLVAFIAGILAGFVTGILHVVMGIPAILAGILTQIALYSVNLKIMGQANRVISSSKYDVLVAIKYTSGVDFYKNTIFIVSCMTVVLIAILYWFFGTELGCSMRATGSNPNMSRAQGINTKLNIVIGLMISNGIVAFASALYGQYQGFSDINMGRGAIVIGLAAVIIGNVIFSRIFRNFALQLLSVSLGAVIYFMVLQIILWFGIDTDLLKLLQALIVAIFLAFPYWKRMYVPMLKSINKRRDIRRQNKVVLAARTVSKDYREVK